MNRLLWTLQILLALAFLAHGWLFRFPLRQWWRR